MANWFAIAQESDGEMEQPDGSVRTFDWSRRAIT